MSGSRVVVTGGDGFLGRHLVERLLARGDEVVILDAATGPGAENVDCRRVVGDIRDPDCVAEAIDPGVDVVYHLAAVVGVDQYLARPLDVIDINFTGTRHILDRATRMDARVVVASTSEVFGKNPEVPWKEDADRVLGPTTTDRWTYSSSKALAEHLTFAFARQHGLAATVVRFFNAYGPGQRQAYVISRSVHRALNGLPPVVYDDGRQTRCFTYVADAVDGAIRAGTMSEGIGQTFNLGTMVETTMGEAVDLVRILTGFDGPPTRVDTAASLGSVYEDLPRRVPDNARARTLLGWRCDTSLMDGITRTVAWARANPWWLARPDTGA